MKRVTVEITFAEGYGYTSDCKKVRTAMINAAVLRATELNMEIASLGARTGHVRKA